MPANKAVVSPTDGRETPNKGPLVLEPQLELPPVTSMTGSSPPSGTRGLGAGRNSVSGEADGGTKCSTGKTCGGTTDIEVVVGTAASWVDTGCATAAAVTGARTGAAARVVAGGRDLAGGGGSTGASTGAVMPMAGRTIGVMV